MEWILGEEPHLAVGKCSFLERVQTGLKGGGIVYSDLPGDSSLARAFESKQGRYVEGVVDRRLKSQVSQLLLIIDSTLGTPSSKLV